MKIFLNGEPIEVSKSRLSYDEVANLAGYQSEDWPSIVWTQQNSPMGSSSGILIPTRELVLFEGMRISCVVTGDA